MTTEDEMAGGWARGVGARIRARLRRGSGVAALLGLAAAAAIVAIFAAAPPLLRALDLALFDQYQRAAPRMPMADPPVRVVVIDSASIEEIGQWPWPRASMAALVDTLAAAGAATIAFDMQFSEVDRTSPARLLRRWRDEGATWSPAPEAGAPPPDYDALFAESVARAPVVLGTFLTPFAGAAPARVDPGRVSVSHLGADPRAAVLRFGGREANLAILEAAAAGVGAITVGRDESGVARSAPLLAGVVTANGAPLVLIPSLGLEALRVALGGPGLITRAIDASGDVSFEDAAPALESVIVGDLRIPTTADGRLWLRWAGRSAAPPIRAADLLSGALEGAALREAVAGRIVFIGASAPGLRDLVRTPLGDEIPGVFAYAEMIEQIVSGDYLARPDWARGAELLAAILGGVVVALLIALAPPIPAALGALALLALPAWLSWRAFDEDGLLVSPAAAMAAVLAAGVLGGSSRYVGAERGRRAVRRQFEHYLAPEIVAEIAEDPRRYLQPKGELRDLTLLFCDIRGFSGLSETLGPEATTEYLLDLLTPMADAVIDEGGAVDKFLGDGLMAFWNAPKPRPDHAERALAAARRMTAALSDVNARFAPRGWPRAEIGVGINTGACVVGPLGSRRRLDYSCIGDAVNLAARLEGLTRVYGVPACVGAETARRAFGAGGAALIEIDRVRVKGRDAPETVFALFGADADDGLEAFRAAYADALAAYRGGAWTDAVAGFRAAGRFTAAPDLAAVMARRAAEMLVAPPASWNGGSWDGVWTASEK